MIPKKVRGVKDILPDTAEKFRFVIDTSIDVLLRFGFREVILPIIEYAELYQHSVGTSTDIVEKQMFQIVPRSEQQETMVLRPEGTAGMVRMFVENRLKDKYPLKRFFYLGPMFRYERPQKGRYREFYQLGLEILGEPPPLSDFLIIKIVNLILEKFSFKYELEVNSIGCKSCREKFKVVLKEKIRQIKEQLCDICKDRIEKNPLRIFDCKTDNVQLQQKFKLNEELNIHKFLCNDCNKNFDAVLHLMNENNIKYKHNPMLVRGLDYYNGFVFEYKSYLLDAAQNTVCAGGRYDEFVSSVDKQTLYGCGAAFGIDRILETIQIDTKYKQEKIKVGLVLLDNKYLSVCIKIIELLTEDDKYIVIGPFSDKSLKSQLRLYHHENCKFVILIGEETKQNKVVVKNFISSTQDLIEIDSLKNFLV